MGAKIPLTYEVVWKKSPVKFEDRFDKYLDPSFFQHRVRRRRACPAAAAQTAGSAAHRTPEGGAHKAVNCVTGFGVIRGMTCELVGTG